MTSRERLDKGWQWFIIIISIVIPVVVSLLMVLPKVPKEGFEGLFAFTQHCPKISATINGTTFFILVGALIAIKKKNINLHKRLIMVALVLSILFLVFYILYHMTWEHTAHTGDDTTRMIYLIILNSHILLSGIIVPLVLVSYARGITMMVEKHRKIAKITLPLWLYVAATGVIVYFMISPYYSFNL